MNRKQLKSLANWLNAEDRKPLIVRGARQIGKSTLVRLFAEQRQRPLAEVNLERYPELNTVFEAMKPAADPQPTRGIAERACDRRRLDAFSG